MDRKTAIEDAIDKHVRGIVMAEWEKLTRKPEPAPLESTPWLVHAEQMNPPWCNCGSAYIEEFRIVRENGKWKHKCRCDRCGYTITRGLVECAEKTDAPNAVHERLEKGGCGWAERAQGYRDWHAPGTKASWFPCPCDSCAKARGE